MKKLFISNGILYNCNQYPLSITSDYDEGNTSICIGNKLTEKFDMIEIPFVKKKNYSWPETIAVRISDLIKRDNKWIFEKYETTISERSYDNCAYALIYFGKKRFQQEGGELYIQKKHKENVTVLKKYEFFDTNPLYDVKYLDRLYLIKIDLPIDESIIIYLATENSKIAQECIEFNATSYIVNIREYETYWHLTEMIPLSEL